MTVQAFIIATEAEKTAAETMNGFDAAVEGLLIDNPLANSLGEGVLVGKYVFPARLLNDPAYARWAAPSVGFPNGMGALLIRVLDSETLVLPPPPEE